MKAYQIALVLLLGWAAGRLPQWLTDSAVEEAQLEAVLEPAAARAATGSDAAVARMAAEVAAQVAAQVADETVARLVAAGWGPRGSEAPVQRIVLEVPRGVVPEQRVRIVTETTPQVLDVRYSLPPATGQAASGSTAVAEPVGKAAEQAAPRAASPAAYAAAAAGYEAIRAGDREQGVRLLKSAVAMDPQAPQAADWEAEVRQQTRRWSVAAYSLAREGSGEALAAAPVLGGGQAGAAVAWRVNPLGKQRISVVGRVTAAAGPEGGIDGQTTEAALGLRWEPSREIPIAIDVERRFALGLYGRNAWAARVSGGAQKEVGAFGQRLKLEGYAETGVVEGFTDTPDVYAGGQLRGAVPLFRLGQTRFDAGAGAWAGVQRSFGVTASRLDLGPSARIRIMPWPFFAQVDYRARVAGNALPGSGPVLTVAGEF
jgi:hypothetical protein